MKFNNFFWVLIALSFFTCLGSAYSEFTLADSNISSEDSNPPVRCDEEGNCYREQPKSAEIPHIITPRQRMKIYSKNPILRWYPVKNVQDYTIEILGIEINWKKNIEGEHWWTRYDGEELSAGEEYLFTVNANNGRESSQDSFIIIDREEAEQIEQQITQLNTTIPAGEEQDIAIAQLYLDNDLIIDAIDVLELLSEKNTQNPKVYCLLSELYQIIQVPDIAEQVDIMRRDRNLSCPD